MPQVKFTQNLERHLSAPAIDVAGRTVREALDAVFHGNPMLRSYVLDDQGRLRRHVVVFVDGQMVEDRDGLTDAVESSSELFVMQALSGG
ncbi:MAG TPA: MoaD/ThiS family protein [Candidatus Polarisedimenticolaceae bacterium]|nr:MoaD/ThiS family protein [Candidatus Polarisedimenticolaceae bacterium]